MKLSPALLSVVMFDLTWNETEARFFFSLKKSLRGMLTTVWVGEVPKRQTKYTLNRQI